MRYRATKTLHVKATVYAPGEMFDPAHHDLPQQEVDWLLRQEAIEPLSGQPAPAPEPQPAPSVRRGR